MYSLTQLCSQTQPVAAGAHTEGQDVQQGPVRAPEKPKKAHLGHPVLLTADPGDRVSK